MAQQEKWLLIQNIICFDAEYYIKQTKFEMNMSVE
jgi:hypothetical protein